MLGGGQSMRPLPIAAFQWPRACPPLSSSLPGSTRQSMERPSAARALPVRGPRSPLPYLTSYRMIATNAAANPIAVRRMRLRKGATSSSSHRQVRYRGLARRLLQLQQLRETRLRLRVIWGRIGPVAGRSRFSGLSLPLQRVLELRPGLHQEHIDSCRQSGVRAAW